MINFVCFKWGQKYTATHVNTLARMLARHCAVPHRLIVVTNEPEGIDWRIGIVADRQDFADWPSPHGKGAPSCYRRLRLFAPDAGTIFGERIVAIDLDTVITGPIAPLFNRPEDFVAWQDPLSPKQLCGSLWMLKAGSHPEVWDIDRHGVAAAYSAGFRGSDQAWLSYKLPNARRWTEADGVYSFRAHCPYRLPADARVVFFHGKPKQDAPGLPAWVATHYQ